MPGFRNPFAFLFGLAAPGKAGQLVVAGYSIRRQPVIKTRIAARPLVASKRVLTSTGRITVLATSARQSIPQTGILISTSRTSAVPRISRTTSNIDVQ